ncbi:carbamoyltransferase HypF [Lebetimonas sp. JH292]|uniref:carbamoyltransferase HypF n=1 Tax=Lebetimonas sp. JH292 TaxID=990068 RepID=UPI00350FAB38
MVSIKGLGGFHLVCDATNEKAVLELRERKRRPSKPFAIMFKNIENIKKYCEINENDEKLILSKEKPIVIVKKKKELTGIAPGIGKYGVFLPYTPVHFLLFNFLDFPIVATSANISNDPIIRDSDELIKKLGNVVDYILDYNRDIVNACDDSVVQSVKNKFITMRLSRGYAPKSFSIKQNIKPNILAVGANQKNTITLAFNNKMILSPHIGDLGTIDSIEYFERTIETFRRLYDFKEDIIICDKHPYYESTKWAKNQKKEIIQIQHHFAHALSGLFEFDLNEALVFAWDGTGYGDDGAIWGGEVFIANRKNFERVHHFKYFKLIGGEKAVKYPANMAVSLLNDEIGKKYSNYKLASSLKNGNFPLTSSVGRIFDMVAFLGGMIERNEYEGFSGMLIERYYNPLIKEYIDLKINKRINFYPLIEFLAKNRGNFELISSVFLNSLANLIKKISKNYNLPVLLTGGVFQNKTMLSLVDGFYFNQKIPVNDGGISVGQAAYGVWNL